MSIVDELVAVGWTDGGYDSESCVWQAWPRHTSTLRRDLRYCECNHAPPSIVAEYTELHLGGRRHQSVEVVLYGERGGSWFKLRAYALALTADAVEAAARSLGAAWEALP